jgi:two-component system sensor histidine kinase/response regulator
MSGRILLIDDEPNLLLALGDYLELAGYEIRSASSGKEGLKTLLDWQPDLIICDIMMPDMDGFEVRRTLEEDPRYRNTPFIFLTAKAQLDDRLQGLRSGADDYVIKPFEAAELEARVEALLRRHRRSQTVAEREVDVLKQNILAAVTHELRTPVAVVRGTLELALEDAFGGDPEQQRIFLSRALANTRGLQRLIDDLLLMASIDAGDLGLFLETVPVAGLLRYCQKNVWRSEAADALVVELPNPPTLTLCVDQRYIRIVVSHLVDNALKFSPPGSPVQVRAEVRDNGVAITVIDQGVGVATADLERIFERFHQTDMSSTRAYEGLGCGLYLVRALVEAHGGYVEVESEIGVGSQFTVWLPREMSEGSYRLEDLPYADGRGG